MNPTSYEIDAGGNYIGYREAFDLIHSYTRPKGTEEISMDSSMHRIAAEDVIAPIDYPSVDISLKDGYAVKSADVAQASTQRPISLTVIGSVFAGSNCKIPVRSGSAAKICSGAPIPTDADAVVAAEFCKETSGKKVHIMANAEKGRNILQAGAEIKTGNVIVRQHGILHPGNMGLAAAAGIDRVHVYRLPTVAIIGVGDEIVAPGEELRPGQIYASNLINLKAWLSSFHIECRTSVVRDDGDAIKFEIRKRLPHVDAVLTSGGAWGSERDLVISTFRELGWREIFHHVRMGPGKGIAFGIFKNKPIFCLPGGPASNEMAFLQLALPGILLMSGNRHHPLQTVPARLTEDLKSRHRNWTEFKDAILSGNSDGTYTVQIYGNRSRLQSIANANSLVCIPEGTEILNRGDIVPVQSLRNRLGIP